MSGVIPWEEPCRDPDQFLLTLVDIVWQDVNEDQSVPCTTHAKFLIQKARNSFNLNPTSNEPKGCLRERDETICDGCGHNIVTMVPHPGGVSTASKIESWECGLGHFEDDF
jgi:hypothetical protein